MISQIHFLCNYQAIKHFIWKYGYEIERYFKRFFYTFCGLSCYMILRVTVSNSHTRLDKTTYIQYQLAIKRE